MLLHTCRSYGPATAEDLNAESLSPPMPRVSSKEIGGEFGEFGALAFLQFDVGGDGLFAEFADDEVEAVR